MQQEELETLKQIIEKKVTGQILWEIHGVINLEKIVGGLSEVQKEQRKEALKYLVEVGEASGITFNDDDKKYFTKILEEK